MTTTANSEKSIRKRVRKLWLIGAAILLMGLIVTRVWLVEHRTPALLQVATKVAVKGHYSELEFAWVSNDEYVYFSGHRRTLLLYRLKDGVSTQLVPPWDSLSEGSYLQVSPNGEWVYWTKSTYPNAAFRSGMYNGPVRLHHYITRLADMHTQEATGEFMGRWEPDSRHLFAFYTVYDGISKTTKQVIGISNVLLKEADRTVPLESNIVSNLSAPETIMTSPNRLLEIVYSTDGSHKKGSAELVEYGVDRTVHITRKWSVTLPPRTGWWRGKISPTGYRVAWLVHTDYADPGLAALHRLLPFLKTPSQLRQELWISRLDGTEMHVLGQLPIRKERGNKLLIDDFRWLPDGRHLSFVYDDALWKIPFDERGRR